MKTVRFAAGLAASLWLGVALPALAQQALRPEVGKPLAAAKSFYNAHNYAKANAALRQAEAARNKTPEENFVIEEMRGAIAQASGDLPTAVRVYQDLLASGRVPAAEQIKLIQAEATIAYQQKNYPAAITWFDRYFKAGGTDASMRTYQIQSYYLSKDYANAAKLQAAQIEAARKAGQKPSEQQLQLLASCYENLGDKTAFQNTMVQLVYFYPKPDYWLNLIHNVETKPGFARDRFTLDIDRFELAQNLPLKTDEYIEATELALQVPLPGEAKAIVDKGYAAGALGTGPEAARHQRLRDLVNKTYDDQLKQLGKTDAEARAEHDGNRLFALGEEYNSFGKYTTGIPMMEEAIKKGGLRHPEDAKLHLALAYLNSGNKARAQQLLRTVGGKDGASDIAYLWLLALGR